MPEHTLDLGAFRSKGTKVFAGRGRGRAVRKAVRLEQLDAEGASVRVVVPEDTYAVNTSFFLGLFGDSIRALGSELFRERYRFEGRDISRVVEDGIEEALRVSSPFSDPE